MCEFCTKHGDGKKWYLQAKNYADDLASDLKRRKKTIGWFRYFNDDMARDVDRMDNLFPRFPAALRRTFASLFTYRQKREHFGQVVPMEDIESIFSMVNSIVRVPCVCRRATLGKDVAYCLGISASPGNMMDEVIDSTFCLGPDARGMDRLTPAEASEFVRGLEQNGVMHSVWTFETPFIGAICNCDRSGCVATRATVNHGLKVMFKGEYVAEVNPGLCTGCRQCERLCQFGAIAFNPADRKACVDLPKCYGCGICRAGCDRNAITLKERSAIPIVARDW